MARNDIPQTLLTNLTEDKADALVIAVRQSFASVRMSTRREEDGTFTLMGVTAPLNNASVAALAHFIHGASSMYRLMGRK